MGTEDSVKVDVVEEGNEREQEVEVEVEEGEGEEEVEGEGEGEGEEDEGEYTFRFEEGINPLDFVEDNAASGIQPYEQFERLEYEALAEKKRKLLADWQRPAKKASQEDIAGARFDEIMEAMNIGGRRKSRKLKKRGRRKGSKNKVSPEIEEMIGVANIHYSQGCYDKVIPVLHEVIRLAPNLPEPYHTLGLVHDALGDYKKALNFYMFSARLKPKDPTLWKTILTWSIEHRDSGQANYCFSKAIAAEPTNISVRSYHASFHEDRGDYQKAAESYEQIYRLIPENIEAIIKSAKLYQECGQLEHSIHLLEDYVKTHPSEADLSVIDLLAAIFMKSNAHDKALQIIEHANLAYCSGKGLPLNLTIKEGICHAQLKNMEKAEILFSVLQPEGIDYHADLITEAADSLMNLEHYRSALKYYLMLEGGAKVDHGFLYLKIARCYSFLKERVQAILFLYKALQMLEDNVDARLTLASLLLEEAKEDEAISLLTPPKDLDSIDLLLPEKSKPWWLNEKVKLKLALIYRAKGMLQDFVDAIFPLVRESLYVETLHPKVKLKKRLSRRVLFERVKVLEDHGTENLFSRFRPVAPSSYLSKAARAKRLLQKKETLREKKKAEALASGADWQSDYSDDEQPQEVLRVPPLPNLLKDEEHHSLIIDLCKSLASLRRYWEALEIINLTLRLAHNMLSAEKKEELRSLGAQIAYNTTDPKHGFDCVKYIVQQHSYSLSAWNCYYKVVSRLENRDSRHCKFLRAMLGKLLDCVPPIIIYGHQFTMASNHQHAASKYLEAYKLLPENPLINLCVGTSLINLALGFRLQNKHQCIAQGLAFLYNNSRLCENSQEALYNIARAYHHVGLVTLAASYYEKVLAVREKDYPIPKLPCENPDMIENRKPGYCDLRREAAYNLHLIYKKSGALDLARQVLKDHCTI